MLEGILQANPADVFARYGLALEHVSREKYEAAVAEFERLLKDHAEYVPGHQMLAQTLLRMGRTAEATAAAQKGIDVAERVGNKHAAAEMRGLLDEIGSA